MPQTQSQCSNLVKRVKQLEREYRWRHRRACSKFLRVHSSVKLPKLLFSFSNLLQLERMGGNAYASHCGITQLHILC